MSIKTDLYEQWSATAQTAATDLANASSIVEAEFARHKKGAYEDGARILHEADGVDHVKKALRERMRDNALRTKRNHYAYMLNDVESALESGQHRKGRSDES